MLWTAFRSHLGHLSVSDQERVERAFRRGEEIHSGQKRKSGEPYFTHPVAVATILAEMSADADTLVAGFLHDAVEDTPHTLEMVEKEFGTSTRLLIDGVTKLEAKDFADKPTLDEQIETTRKIFTLMQQDVRIMVIKLADRLHNMQTIAALSPERQKTYAQETLDVYVKVADRLGMGDMRTELEQLCHRALEPEHASALMQLRERNRERSKELIAFMREDLQKSFPALVESLALVHERRRWEKLAAQWAAEKEAVTGVASATIAFVCETIDRCYQILGALHQLWRREEGSFQDFINSPMINGYRGLHTTVILKDGTRVRCKIRTKEMQEYARRGITTRCFGHRAQGVLDTLPWVERISPLSQDTATRSKEFQESLQSDILGESIVIHGPGDATVQLPRGATALDAAFYLFGDKALRTTTVTVNASPTALQTPIDAPAAVSVEFSERRTVRYEWLSWTRTSLATAIIRRALAEEGATEKIATGKRALQEEFDRYSGGNMYALLTRKKQILQRCGAETLDALFMRIAEGRIAPAEILALLQDHGNGESARSRALERMSSFWSKGGNPTITLSIGIAGERRQTHALLGILSRLIERYGLAEQYVALTERRRGARLRLRVQSGDREKLDRFFLDLQSQPSVRKIIIYPARELVLKIFLAVVVTFGTWLSFFFLLQRSGSSARQTLTIYTIIIPVIVVNLLTYRFIVNYFPLVRKSRWSAVGIFGINAVAILVYAITVIAYRLDVWHLSLFFPLTILVLSCAAVFYIFLQQESPTGVAPLPGPATPRPIRRTVMGYVIRLCAVIIWGIEPLYIKYTVTNTIDPLTRIPLKAIGGILPSLLLGAMMLPWLGENRLRWRIPHNGILATIVVGEILFTYLLNASLTHTSSTNVILLNNFAPVIALIVGALLWKSSIPYLRSKKNILAMLALFITGSTGASLLFYNDFKNAHPGNLYGDVLAMFLMLTDVVLVIAMIRYVQNLVRSRSVALNFYVFLFALCVSAPIVLLFRPQALHLSEEQLLFGIGAGVISGVGRILNFEAFRLIDGFLAFLMFNVAILITFLSEAFLLGEVIPTELLIVGGLMIVVASIAAEYINSRSQRVNT